MKKQLKRAWKILLRAGNDFAPDGCFRFSAALSFYTLFSIAPLILLSIYTASVFLDSQSAREEIMTQFQYLMGEEGAEGVKVLIETFRTERQNFFSLLFGIGILLFSATNIFVQLQLSFNALFHVKARRGKFVIKQLYDRVLSLSMIITLGLMLIISFMLEAAVSFMSDKLPWEIQQYKWLIITGENVIIFSIITFIIFALFRFLPDVVIKKKYLLVSSLVTTLLLVLGKFGIGWYIGNSNFSQLSGASASVIIFMLWVYYSSVIIFFGAELLKAQCEIDDVEVPATRYAERLKLVEITK